LIRRAHITRRAASIAAGPGGPPNPGKPGDVGAQPAVSSLARGLSSRASAIGHGGKLLPGSGQSGRPPDGQYALPATANPACPFLPSRPPQIPECHSAGFLTAWPRKIINGLGTGIWAAYRWPAHRPVNALSQAICRAREEVIQRMRRRPRRWARLGWPTGRGMDRFRAVRSGIRAIVLAAALGPRH
jgi:hypothetical protein